MTSVSREEQPYPEGYRHHVDSFRDEEYPMLKDSIYLDHAGSALPAKSLMDRFSADMITNLYANTHSGSVAALNTSRRIERIRLRLLEFFNADPEAFDLVFVANTTAAIKLVAESLRDAPGGFWYGYHRESHTSLVGVRELANDGVCFESDLELDTWLSAAENGSLSPSRNRLLGIPAQSNMNGRRLPLDWCGKARRAFGHGVYSMLDAAGLVSTSPLSLQNTADAPDFTCVSLYKIFGFPEIGALVVRKKAATAFNDRRYFGGGTVDMAICGPEKWHVRKSGTVHEQLEDGSLPVRNIIALESAMHVHMKLHGSIEEISKHCHGLASHIFQGLSVLRHPNGLAVCRLYHAKGAFDRPLEQGPIIAFNIRDRFGSWIATSEVEKLAAVKGIHLRSGSLCNPGGVAGSLGLGPEDLQMSFAEGFRCGGENDLMRGKPTGMLRVSIGPMNTIGDITAFLQFVEEVFVDAAHKSEVLSLLPGACNYTVERLTVFPIKSCSGWSIPRGVPWRIRKEGLAWDREWCLILAGGNTVMSQKRYPRMSLIRPSIDLENGLLHVSMMNGSSISVPLSPNFSASECRTWDVNVCGDNITAQAYDSHDITTFFTQALGVPCRLARFPPGASHSSRHAKPHSTKANHEETRRILPGCFTTEMREEWPRPILLSNESPILVISRPSVDRLNEQIKSNGGKAVSAEVFRANIIVAEHSNTKTGMGLPYIEDQWHMMKIGQEHFELLGPCRRCQMVCINPENGQRHCEPLLTLAKTRRRKGMIFFGQHSCHVPNGPALGSDGEGSHEAFISVDDTVEPFQTMDEAQPVTSLSSCNA